MTPSKNLASCLLAAAALSSCSVDVNTNGRNDAENDGVRRYGSFVAITNRSDADIVLVQVGNDLKKGDLRIVCDGGLTGHVASSVSSDGSLVIQAASGMTSVLGCTLHVVSDGVRAVNDEGDGNVVCGHRLDEVVDIRVKGNGSVELDTVDADQLNLLVTGTGSLDIANVVAGTLDIDLRGAGDASLAGTAHDARLAIAGGGSLMAQALTVATTLDATLNGTGDGAITVNGTVNANVAGPARLDIYGTGTPGTIIETDGGAVAFH